MYALFFAGILFAVGATFVLGGGFFLEAWRFRKREREYMLFGLATVALGGYSLAGGGMYLAAGVGARQDLGWLSDLAFGFTHPSAALLVDFALSYTRRGRRWMRSACYAFAAVGIAVSYLGFWRVQGVPHVGEALILGLHMPAIQIATTWLGQGIIAGNLAMVVVVCGCLIAGRRHGGGQRERPVMLAGAFILLVGALQDASALAFAMFESVSLLPIGFIFFVYGVAVTLVARYARLSDELAEKKAELSARSDELSQSLSQLQQAQEELLHSEQLAVVGEFAAVITHEVRNPMSIVNNAVTTLRRADAVTDDTRSLLGIIEQEMMRLERLVTHLLNYARPVVPQREAVELSSLLEEVTRGALGPHPDVAFSVRCKGDWPTVYVDRAMIAQTVDNIVVNAIQAMDARGELHVKVARRRVDGVGCVVIGFEDTGEGMNEHQLEQATSPFYTTRPAGTGLGLAICERIVDAHGGMLVVNSERGVGTAVSIILPEKPDERLRVSRRVSSTPPAREAPADSAA